MRKRYRVLMLAAVVAALVVPVGFALSIESSTVTQPTVAHLPTAAVASSTAVASVAIVAPANSLVASSASHARFPEIPDAAKLLLIGTTLFGVAAAVRKRSTL